MTPSYPKAARRTPLPDQKNMQTSSVASRLAFVRATRRTPSLLSAALMASVGISLSTLSSAGWAQDAAAATTADSTTPPAVSAHRRRASASSRPTPSRRAAGFAQEQVVAPFSTVVRLKRRARTWGDEPPTTCSRIRPARLEHPQQHVAGRGYPRARDPIDTLNGTEVRSQASPRQTDLAQTFEQVLPVVEGLSRFMFTSARRRHSS